MRVLNIESSPRGSRSASIAITSAFLEAYRQACPGIIVDRLNVWEEKLPDFDQEAIGAQYKGINKEPMDQAETAIWDKIQELAARFQQADHIVLGVPMWNFAYPYKLKQLIDLVSQRNMLFTYDGNDYGPLLTTPRAFVVYARGGTYVVPASMFLHLTTAVVNPQRKLAQIVGVQSFVRFGGLFQWIGMRDVNFELS
jgi:FMN-dependent NADH-azoreductase